MKKYLIDEATLKLIIKHAAKGGFALSMNRHFTPIKPLTGVEAVNLWNGSIVDFARAIECKHFGELE